MRTKKPAPARPTRKKAPQGMAGSRPDLAGETSGRKSKLREQPQTGGNRPAPSGPQAKGDHVLFSLSEAETEEFGRRLGRDLTGGEMVLLIGNLGAGKTVFVRGMAAGLGIDPAEISSPTFVLVSPHAGRVPLYHVDLYRIKAEEEVYDLGIEECIAEGGVVAVEWGERLPLDLRETALEVRFADLGDDSRRLTLRVLRSSSDS